MRNYRLQLFTLALLVMDHLFPLPTGPVDQAIVPLVAAALIGGIGSLLGGFFGNRAEQRRVDQARADQQRLLAESRATDRGDFTNREAVRTGANATRGNIFSQAADRRGFTGAAYDPALTTARAYPGFDPLRALGGQRLQPTAGGGSSLASGIFNGIGDFAPFLANQGRDENGGLSPALQKFLEGIFSGPQRTSIPMGAGNPPTITPNQYDTATRA